MVLVVLVVGVAVNAAKPVNIGCVIYKFDDTFMTGVRNNIDAAAKTVGAKVDIVDAQNMQATCNDKVDLFITKKVNALAVNPVDLSACGVIIDKAKKANIPLVLFNRQPFKDDMAKWNKVYYVGAIAAQSG
ncbi:MAG TPA: methyl-galactoside ABC transporter substrate-binding protein, partial [Firmicutes bacterium]|nr:methyl-galactoside ABC transporter substrate-binding protein [Bacillota bacterium]